jgi:hypothetical protein
MSIYKAINRLLRSKEMKEVAPYIPYGSLAMGTLEKINDVIHDAKEGDPVAIETVKEVKTRATMGDPQAKATVATMKVVSKKQSAKTSLYARGMSVGHDPVSIGAVRRHSSGTRTAPQGTAARVTDHRGGTPVTYYTPPAGGGANPYTQWGQKAVAPPPMIGPSVPIRTKLPPMPVQPQEDPYGGTGYPQQGVDPFGGGYQDPYGQYGGYPYDPYAGYGGYGGFDSYGGFNPYGLSGLPPGYGFSEEPVIDRGGYQQYDAATDSFFSSNQKQVYDESTGMFYPVSAENPYGNPYGF